MRSDVTVIFDASHSVDLSVDIDPSPQRATQARDWFEGAWETLGCEPLRPSGKVLALGYDTLKNDEKESREFAEQAALALGKARITVDLPGLTVGY